MRPALLLVLGIASASCLPAQPSLSGPVEALTFDAPTRSLRAVIGFPGAASFGPVLLDSLDFASVAPRQNYGIVFQSGNCLFAAGLGSQAVSTVAIAGVAARPDGIAWSRDGSLAVLYSSAGRWFQTITGFPNAPVAGQMVDASNLGASLTAVAVDATGKQIAIAISGDNGGVYQTTGGQDLTTLVAMSKPMALSFSADAQTLYALDAGTLQVTAVSLSGHGFQTLALPGIANPVGIQSVQDSQNRQLLYVAAGSDRMLRILDVASQQIVTDVQLNFQPTSLDQFGSGSFVVASRSQSAKPLWLFASTPQPGAYFVPAIQLARPNRRSTGVARRTR
jgi:hypothetical protein